MRNNWQKIKEWWHALAEREKWMISVGASFLGLFLIYIGIWSPILNHLDGMRNEITSRQKLLTWMQKTEIEIKQREKQPQKNRVTSLVALLSLLQKQIEQAGLTENLTQLNQAATDGIEVRFQKIEFDKLSKLLINFSKDQPVMITKASIASTDDLGLVNAYMILNHFQQNQ